MTLDNDNGKLHDLDFSVEHKSLAVNPRPWNLRDMGTRFRCWGQTVEQSAWCSKLIVSHLTQMVAIHFSPIRLIHRLIEFGYSEPKLIIPKPFGQFRLWSYCHLRRIRIKTATSRANHESSLLLVLMMTTLDLILRGLLDLGNSSLLEVSDKPSRIFSSLSSIFIQYIYILYIL